MMKMAMTSIIVEPEIDTDEIDTDELEIMSDHSWMYNTPENKALQEVMQTYDKTFFDIKR